MPDNILHHNIVFEVQSLDNTRHEDIILQILEFENLSIDFDTYSFVGKAVCEKRGKLCNMYINIKIMDIFDNIYSLKMPSMWVGNVYTADALIKI